MSALEDDAVALRAEVRRWLWRLLLGTILLLPLAWIVYVAPWSDAVGTWGGLILATPIFAAIGGLLWSSGLRRFHYPAHRGDLLLALGVTIAYGVGLWQFSQFIRQLVGHRDPTIAAMHGGALADAALMLTFVALGKYLQALALERAAAPLRNLLELTPERTICVRDGQQTTVPTHDVAVDETILIRPGTRVPLDVRVLSGSSQIDQSWLTGDTRPVECGPDSPLCAGTLNGGSALIGRVTCALQQSTPQRIYEALRGRGKQWSRMQRQMDRASTWIVVAMPVITGAIFGAWLILVNLHAALEVAIAMLLCGSVSALALSTVTPIAVGMGRGAWQGVFLGGAKAAEASAALTTTVLEKSAAVTPGLPAVVEILPHSGVRSDELLVTAATAAQYGDLPLAASIVAETRRRALRIPNTRSHNVVPDRGIITRTLNGETLVGVETLLVERHVDITPLRGRLAALRAAGRRPWLVAVGKRLFGVIAMADVVAPYSRQAVGQLRALGLRVVLLSRDVAAVTAAVAREVSFDDVRGGSNAEQQLEIISRLRSSGRTVGLVAGPDVEPSVVAAADVYLALGSTQHAGTADVVLPGDLRSVGRAILLSRAIVGAVRANLGFAITFNALLIPLAAAGLLPGVLAAAASGVASVLVVVNSIMLGRKRID